MRTFFMFALLLAASLAVELDKPEQQLPDKLPVHIQTLITNHINHVLQTTTTTTQKPHGQTATVLTGHVPQLQGEGKGKSTIAVPHLDLLPPHVEQPKTVPQVINHTATGTWQQHAAPVADHNKVVMPPVSQIVVTVPGKQPQLHNVGDKVNQLHQKVSYIMQQAEKHIPLAINQAISEREKLNAQKEKQKQKEKQHSSSSTSTTSAPEHHKLRLISSEEVQVPELTEAQRDLQELGKCNYNCPEKALPVCASNGKCVVEFPGQCELSQWNCFNTKNVFSQVHDDECRNTIRCYERDMQ
ncbi:uncharacterized protein LOC132791509 [Drosophila nasuta]|uniref:uncharacterized protein LOC132791509 n=1 Tax=Drosophila nasuta TaxID=42062 RepID=UPI00295EC087|nr:uncharacterized protein LOC132791509 [Drosophila nasuta]